MKESDFTPASSDDRNNYITRPYDEIPMTQLVEGSDSHLVLGDRMMLSFLTMKAGSVFERHSHSHEQIMFVLEGYCDEVIGDKIFRVQAGDVIRLPSNVLHGAFIRDVDCKVIDIFVPVRDDYAAKYRDQNPQNPLRFTE